MICQKCNATVEDNALFCSNCGENLAIKSGEIKYCSSCGEEVKEGNKFCAKCGAVVSLTNISENSSTDDGSSDKISGSYFVSIISAIICFIIRIVAQEEYYLRDGLFNGKHVMGIYSEDTKTFLTFLPVIAGIIVSLMIVTDKKVSSQEKLKALIINAVFIALSILFIWFNIPWEF